MCRQLHSVCINFWLLAHVSTYVLLQKLQESHKIFLELFSGFVQKTKCFTTNSLKFQQPKIQFHKEFMLLTLTNYGFHNLPFTATDDDMKAR